MKMMRLLLKATPRLVEVCGGALALGKHCVITQTVEAQKGNMRQNIKVSIVKEPPDVPEPYLPATVLHAPEKHMLI